MARFFSSQSCGTISSQPNGLRPIAPWSSRRSAATGSRFFARRPGASSLRESGSASASSLSVLEVVRLSPNSRVPGRNVEFAAGDHERASPEGPQAQVANVPHQLGSKVLDDFVHRVEDEYHAVVANQFVEVGTQPLVPSRSVFESAIDSAMRVSSGLSRTSPSRTRIGIRWRMPNRHAPRAERALHVVWIAANDLPAPALRG